jgi:hypothetical protein
MSDTRALEAIDVSVGPAPWYWKTFQPIIGSSGRPFVWTLEDRGKGRQYVRLERADEARFIAYVYARAFPVPPNLLGVWFPVLSDTPPRGIYEVRVLCFDPEKLPALEGPTRSQQRIYYSAGGPPVSQFSIPVGLGAGNNALDIPREFHSIEELLIVDEHRGDDARTAIYAVYPRIGRVEVFPQLWFKGFQDGYEWITRVTRHPVSRVFIGDGIRIGKFELTEDGCQLARWIVR